MIGEVVALFKRRTKIVTSSVIQIQQIKRLFGHGFGLPSLMNKTLVMWRLKLDYLFPFPIISKSSNQTRS